MPKGSGSIHSNSKVLVILCEKRKIRCKFPSLAKDSPEAIITFDLVCISGSVSLYFMPIDINSLNTYKEK
jgi:hypothetical protein